MLAEKPTPPIIRPAESREADFLSQLALRSKAHWGYSQDFLDACRTELTVDESRIGTDDYLCFVALDDNPIVGFYTLEMTSAVVGELDALFVEPHCIGSGVGSALVRHAVKQASKAGLQRIVIQGDPNATGFYSALGAQQVGTQESGSVPGRELPLFEIDIASQ